MIIEYTPKRQPYLAFGISFYNDAKSLERCLQSIFFNRTLMRWGKFKVFLIDGKYKGYPARDNLSTDGSREIAKGFVEDYPPECELHDYPNLHERHKRQKYVDLAAQHHIPWLIILDSDEWIEMKPEDRAFRSFMHELEHIEEQWLLHNKVNTINDSFDVEGPVSNVHDIRCIDMDESGMYPVNVAFRPRLWYRPQDMTYTTKHFYFKNRHIDYSKLSLDQQTSFQTHYVKSIAMYHDHSLRDQDREQRRVFYERERLARFESEPQKQKQETAT